ncbi:hopanoid-associated sugar epimerase [Enterovirga aerilata]|uniref:NAD-dependent epimerase/dehydratase family protein n=1 Tax=Enterovirga aerilata TaxID=2730920 RepID=A0A849I3B5_9HYPH|nr:hopanoid-associated sugar epimerase [Enterovirga sp. DB1703]NNM71831.1 NAD-dependent epimerase/dehydratase family protein [Enterovirga sp. DB1703]
MAERAGERDRVLVTGASGFLGSAIAKVFRDAGFAVRVMVRASSPRTNLSDLDEVATGDLTDPATLGPALKGVRYLVHAAADYRLWAKRPQDLVEANVEGSRNIMRAALREGVERIVYTSSVATIVPGGDETRPLTPETAIGIYKRSKVMAERAVEEMVARDRLPAVIVNPSTPIGPRDVKPTPTGRVIVEAASGKMPGFVDTGLNLAHVDDVAAGHLLALRHGRIGERYILGGENVLLSRMLADIAEMVGRRPPSLRIPRLAVWPIAVGAEAVAQITGREPFVCRDALRMAAYKMFFDDAKARRELGYTSRPYREGLADAIGWFRKAGYLR